MGSGKRQGQLWSVAPRDWAELQEPFYLPLWQDTLSVFGVLCPYTQADGTIILRNVYRWAAGQVSM